MPLLFTLLAQLIFISGTAMAQELERVVDGDTIRVMINGQSESVRIIGIDTPEPSKEQCYAQEASNRMKALIAGKDIALQRNPAEDRDTYNRLLRYVHVNGADIGALMISEGYARSYRYFRHPRRAEYNRLEDAAKATGQGLWSECIKNKSPYLPAVKWARAAGILQGYPDGSFRLEQTTNRAEFLKMILESRGVEARVVDESEPWYQPYVRYARKHKIAEGYPDGTFKPGQPVNYAEALKMAYLALGIKTEPVEGAWYQRYLHHARNNNVLFNEDMDVSAEVSRQDVVWIVYKLMDK